MFRYSFPFPVAVFLTDLSAVLISGGIIGDLEMAEVDHFPHLIVVPSPLADDYSSVEQKNMSAAPTHVKMWHESQKQKRPAVKVIA